MPTNRRKQNAITLLPVFRKMGHDDGHAIADQYEAAYVTQDNDAWGARVVLDADIVERAIFNGTSLMLRLGPNGQIHPESDDLSDEGLDALAASLQTATLENLLMSAFDPDALAVEENPTDALVQLATTLRTTLAKVETLLGKHAGPTE